MNRSQLNGRADLHMHTRSSDGKPAVQELLNYVAQHRPELNVIAITDHDALDSSLWAYEAQHRYPFEVVPALEVSSRAGHVLALWVTTLIPRDMDLNDTVSAIHEAGGVAILAHPFHMELDIVRANAPRYWKHPEVLLEAKLDGIETNNSGGYLPLTRTFARRLARQLGLAMLGGSDAHTLGAIGRGITRFAGRHASDLRTAIHTASTQAEGHSWGLWDYPEFLYHMHHWKRQQRQMAIVHSLNGMSDSAEALYSPRLSES